MGGRAARPVVLLTGASSGIGAALAVQLARVRGARLGLMARRADALEAVAASVREAGGEALVVPVDVTDLPATEAAAAAARETFGPIDLAIASAGIGTPMRMDGFDAALCARTMRVNYEGATNLFAAVLPEMLERGAGHLVGVSSVAAFRGLPASGPYSASKAALTTLLESMRLELKPRGIAVTAIHPGFIRTPMTDTYDFRMPFLVEVEDAAKLLERRLRSMPREIEFPWQLVFLGKLARWSPNWLYDLVLGDRVGRRG